MSLLLVFLALVVLVAFLVLAGVSHREGEDLAVRRSILIGLAMALVLVLLAWAPIPGGHGWGWLVIGLMVAGGGWLLFPTGPTAETLSDDSMPPRVDERTIMFSRAELKPGTSRHDHYYQDYPQHRSDDDRFRKLPGLMSPHSGKYEPVSFAAAAASFATVDRLAGLTTGQVAETRTPLDREMATRFLKGWAEKLGAVSTGVAAMRPGHFYAVKGRGEMYGQPVAADHAFGLAFAVEMDHRNLGTAPEGPTLMESAQQYLNAGAIAVQLAECIRRLGYAAEAHIDGNYRVVCPLVARDAGLGEIGRMGLLMTPGLGPRVRLGVVTTDLPLVADGPRGDPTILDFCSFCRKCAEACPAQAIPTGDRQTQEGVTRWQIDSEACFTYWCAAGTDCGRCMKVCPYAHPDSLLHNLVRKGLVRSSRFRRAALFLDDILYGRSPGEGAPPAYLPSRQKNVVKKPQ